MGAIPPQFPQLSDTVYTPELPTFTRLASSELGDAGTPGDGFNSIFNPIANDFPGGDAIISELDSLSSAYQDSVDATAQPLDDSFEGDVAVASLQGENLIGNLGDLGLDIQTATLPDFPALSDIPIGALAPGFIFGDTNTALRSITDTTVGVRADGLVAWYIDGREHDPFSVNISVDGGDWALFSNNRGGNQMLGFDTDGHFIAIEWRNERGVLAQAYIDNRAGAPQTQVITAPTPDTGGGDGGGVTVTPPIPSGIPGVPAGLVPSATLAVSPTGLVVWQTSNVTVASVTYQRGTEAETLFSVSNSGSVQFRGMAQGGVYTWRVRDVSRGGVGTVLASVTVTAGTAPPAPAPAPGAPGASATQTIGGLPRPAPAPSSIGPQQDALRKQIADNQAQYVAVRAQQQAILDSIPAGGFATQDQNIELAMLNAQASALTAQEQQFEGQLSILENSPK